MRWLALFAMLVSCCFAQDIEFSRFSDIKLASGFLKVCGRESNKPSEHNLEAMKSTSRSKFSETFQRVLDAGLADLSMCLAYVEGLAEGWQEEHEHGVVAMQFPGNFPHDLQVALKAVPEKQLKDASLAMNTDIPCPPHDLTSGDRLKTVLDYMRGHQLFTASTLTSLQLGAVVQ